MKELDQQIKELAKQVVALFIERGLTLSTAESCTGGAIAAAITAVPGSSAMFKGAVVAYSNSVKSKVLGVSRDSLDQFGAVSNEVVQAMALGVRKLMSSNIAISTSGIAGPTGGTPTKPVGLVHFGMAGDFGDSVTSNIFAGGREKVQKKSVVYALKLVLLSLSIENSTN